MKTLKMQNLTLGALIALFTAIAPVGGGPAGAPEAQAAQPDGKVLFWRGPGNLCVHPKGRKNDIGNNTHLILHSDACNDNDVRLLFKMESNGAIRHLYTGKCIHNSGGVHFDSIAAAFLPENSRGQNAPSRPLVLHDGCSDAKTLFTLLPSGHIQHNTTGKCVAARKNLLHNKHPKNNALLSFFAETCDKNYARFDFRAPRKSFNVDTRIFHTNSALCVHPKGRGNHVGNNTKLILHGDACRTLESRLSFEMIRYGAIYHPFSDKCIHPEGGSNHPKNNTKLVLHEGCTSTKSKFRVLAGGQIQHISSGKCIHPHGGSAQPKPNTSLVLYDGCTGDRLKFAITESSKFRSAPSIPKGRGNRIVHNYSGICVHPEGGGTPKNNTRLVFNADDCSNKGRTDIAFDMLPSGAIRHIASGKCVHPYGGWDFPGRNTVLVLHDGCDARTVEFKFQNGLLFHKMSGMCVHPKGGKTPPRKNDRLVLWDSGCHGERYKLKMVPN